MKIDGHKKLKNVAKLNPVCAGKKNKACTGGGRQDSYLLPVMMALWLVQKIAEGKTSYHYEMSWRAKSDH